MKKWKCANEYGTALNKNNETHVITAATKCEAKAAFKKLYGEKPQNRGTKGSRGHRTKKTKGTRRRLPVGYRVMAA